MRMQSDRFAREIAPILAPSGAARSRRLMREALGGFLRSHPGLLHLKTGQ